MSQVPITWLLLIDYSNGFIPNEYQGPIQYKDDILPV